MTAEEFPPHNIEAEEALIGSLLVDDTVMKRIGNLVGPNDFFREQNRWAYEAALRAAGRGDGIDVVSVAQQTDSAHPGREAAAMRALLCHCIATVPTSVHAEYYARLVHDLANQRREIQRGGQIAAAGFKGKVAQRKARY